MKFDAGDKTDKDFCTALQHEFLQCQEALREFEVRAASLVSQPEDRVLAYGAYNAYTRFIHHLYEFLIAALARERRDTSFFSKRGQGAPARDDHVSALIHRIITTARNAASDRGSEPHLGVLAQDFAKRFRECRNVAYAHVTPKRPHLNLSEFYQKYHPYLCILYQHAREWWSQDEEFPDLKEITSFSVVSRNGSAQRCSDQ